MIKLLFCIFLKKTHVFLFMIFHEKVEFLNIVSKVAPRNSGQFAPSLRSVRFNGAEL